MSLIENKIKNFNDNEIPKIGDLLKSASQLASEIKTRKNYTFESIYDHKKEYIKNTTKVSELLNCKSKETKKENDEISGLYIFYSKNSPLYVGISNGIIKRIKSHMCGKGHHEASLVYAMAVKEDERLTGKRYMGMRKDFLLTKYSTKIQDEMKSKWTFKIIPETNVYKRYYLEAYLAVVLKTHWNCFDTH